MISIHWSPNHHRDRDMGRIRNRRRDLYSPFLIENRILLSVSMMMVSALLELCLSLQGIF